MTAFQRFQDEPQRKVQSFNRFIYYGINALITIIAAYYITRLFEGNLRLITAYSIRDVILVIFSMILIDSISALRIKILFGPSIRYAEAFFLHLYGLILADVTPGRIGYAMILKKLAKISGKGLGEVFSKLIFINAVDTGVKLVMLALAIVFILNFISYGNYVVIVLVFGIISFGALIVSYYVLSKDNKLKKAIIRRFGGYEIIRDLLGYSVNGSTTNNVAVNILLSVLISISSLLSFYLFSRPFNYSFFEAFIVYVFVALSAGIPAGIGGIGVQESTCVLLSSLLGKSYEGPVIAIVYRAFSMIWHSFGLAYVFLYEETA